MLRITFFIGYWLGLLYAKGPFLSRAVIGLVVGAALSLAVYGVGRACGKDLTKRKP